MRRAIKVLLSSIMIITATIIEPSSVSMGGPFDWDCRSQKREYLIDYIVEKGGSAFDIVDSALYASEVFGVDVELLIAIAEVESRFGKYTLSPKGAVGLMQVMPNTAILLSNKYGIPAKLTDSHSSMLIAAAHIRETIDKYGPDVKLALVDYNGGHRVLRRYLRSGRLPKETEAYIKKVLPIYKLLQMGSICDYSFAKNDHKGLDIAANR